MADYPKVQVSSEKITNIIYPDGTQFIPYECDVNFNGFGQINFADESKFVGFVLEGIPTKFGLLESMGVTMYGAFEAAQLQGPGCLQFSDGSVIRSSFQSSVASGFGTAYQKDQETFYQGDFQLNQPDGIGCLFSGDWKNVYGEKQNNCYFGYFMNGQPHGRGIALINDKLVENRFNRYEGYFVEGSRSGSGALFLANGDMLIGQFEYNEKQGLFLYVSERGNFALQYYENNILKQSYTPDLYYIVRPQELRCIVMQQDTTTSIDFEKYVSYLKLLERKMSNKRRTSSRAASSSLDQNEDDCVVIPVLDTVWRYVRKLTVPLSYGLIDDRRVCSPIISEKIAEIARNETYLDYICNDQQMKNVFKPNDNKEQLDQTKYFSGIEIIKSSLVSNYNLLEFAFKYYVTRDNLLIHRQHSYEGNDALVELIQQMNLDLAPFFAKIIAAPVITKNNIEKEDSKDDTVPKQDQGLNRTMSEVETFNELDNFRSSQEMDGATSNQSNEQQSSSPQKDLVIENLGGQQERIPILDHTPENLLAFIKANEIALNILPRGNTALDNQLLMSFFQVIDIGYTISTQSLTEFFRDAANSVQKLKLFQDGEEFFEILLSQNAKQADSVQIIKQFGVQQLFSEVQSVVTFDGFLNLLLDVYPMFQYDTFANFLALMIVPYVKQLMESVISKFEEDQVVVDTFATIPEDKILVDSYIKKQQISVLEQSIMEPSASGMKSIKTGQASRQVAPSQTSLRSKNMLKSGVQSMAVPKVLMRDTNYSLSEMENLLLRTSQLDKKLAKIAKLQHKYERAIAFKKYINEQLEYKITSRFGVNCTQYLNFENLSLLKFLQIFDTHFEIYKVPKLTTNLQFYVEALEPFLLSYKQIEPSAIFDPEKPLTTSLVFQHLQNMKMTANVFIGLMTALALKADLPKKINKRNENMTYDADDESPPSLVDNQSMMMETLDSNKPPSNEKDIFSAQALKLFDLDNEVDLEQFSTIFEAFLLVAHDWILSHS